MRLPGPIPVGARGVVRRETLAKQCIGILARCLFSVEHLSSHSVPTPAGLERVLSEITIPRAVSPSDKRVSADPLRKNADYGLASMSDKESRDPPRRLVYVPIIHTLTDMGALGASVQRVKLSALGRQGLAHGAAVVEKMWEETERVVTRLKLTPGVARVYQDGLPVCGREREIVSELAKAGSRNHGLLLKLEARGAVLMGTESPELLVEEYQLAGAELASGAVAQAKMHRKRLRDTLLERRDRYIADRINATLGAGESGILFIGMLHEVTRYLDSDIDVGYPLGPPRPRQGGGR